jgi:prepilin-type N-terminal cleavage/methylation domain-containing protein
MRKKGFSLVEVSIVLLVLAFIITIVFKSRSIVLSAEYRRDIAKINKLRSVIALYYNDFQELPPVYSTQYILDSEYLIEHGYLNQGDFDGWEYVIGITPKQPPYNVNGEGYFDYPPLSALYERAVPKTVGIIGNKEARFICMFEKMADDGNHLNGNARVLKLETWNNLLTGYDYNHCSGVAPNQYADYGYKVFEY